MGEIYSYLSKIGLIQQVGVQNRIAPLCILPYLKASVGAEELSIVNGTIRYQNRNVSSSFSPQEATVLMVLLNRKSVLVTREIIARALWKEKWIEQYSDWAIDKLFSRLRQSMRRCGVPSIIIRVKKGRGFQIN
ncbi:hypothetical protein COY90_03260 [Candidatus Roizmanbacteria bacterium CG_4_10_14_0_8_um_filter_39_9]|uniref:OmpR/PhoB-type domain-containing protein n=1 Tax=Candidatus Roizmanbacteria bacterium CG_4_10_14_0_8_um_filter_39_9 TaxID=1974829 RepID=A0A2M7QCJ7_9BACT|nr:MAG: hypothetical protein COY90_03260 [Candidatus Roizmanbacteria bacterium CG_4_10_14_0_8_um_filter_39_9]